MKRDLPDQVKTKGGIRCTLGDVERAFKVKREDPEKFARSPRLQWIVATLWKLVDDSERERARRRK